MEQTVTQPETIRDMFVAIQQEAIGRMKASQENIDEIKKKQREALDKGDSENFEIHKLSYESNLRTLDSHRKLVLEITENLDPGKEQDERLLPVITKILPFNPIDMEIKLRAQAKGGGAVELTIKCDLHGLLKQRPFYGFESTDPEIKDSADADLLQAATGFVLRGYADKSSAMEAARDTFSGFVGAPVVTELDKKPSVLNSVDEGKDKVTMLFQDSDGEESAVEIPLDATVVTTRDGKHVWYSQEKVDDDKNTSFTHLMSLAE